MWNTYTLVWHMYDMHIPLNMKYVCTLQYEIRIRMLFNVKYVCSRMAHFRVYSSIWITYALQDDIPVYSSIWNTYALQHDICMLHESVGMSYSRVRISYWRVYVCHLEEHTYSIFKSLLCNMSYESIRIHIEEFTYTYFILKSVYIFYIQEFTYTIFQLKSLYVFRIKEYTYVIHVSCESLRISHWRVNVLHLQFDIRMEGIRTSYESILCVCIIWECTYVI